MGGAHGHLLHFHAHSAIHRAPAHLKVVALLVFMITVVATPDDWFAAFGAYKNRGAQKIEIPAFLIAILPLVFCYALLSGNLGRMFFAAFPVIIPYALVGMRSLLGPAGSGDGVSAPGPQPPHPRNIRAASDS